MYKKGFEPPALKPAKILRVPKSNYLAEHRLWQGSPTITATGSRVWMGWCSGGEREPDEQNFAMVIFSDDGHKWSHPVFIADSIPSQFLRVFNLQLWTDPNGRLWIFWSQTRISEKKDSQGRCISYGDKIFGTWAVYTDDVTSKHPVFSKPKRLCDGFIRHRPTVLGSGRWITGLCDMQNMRHRYLVSDDNGESWSVKTGAMKLDFKTSDDTAVFERKDGLLWSLSKNNRGKLSQCFSANGENWTPIGYSLIENPVARFWIGRLKSGRTLLINHYNFLDGNGVSNGKVNLTALISENEGETWAAKLRLDSKTGCCPDAVQSENGRIHIVYERDRYGAAEICYCQISETDILNGKIDRRYSFMNRTVSKLREPQDKN